MNKAAYECAVLGAGGLVGRSISEILGERGFPLASLRLFDTDERLGSATADVSAVEPIDRCTGPFDLAFIAEDREMASLEAERLANAGAVVIDVSGSFALDEDVPLVVPECNAERVSSLGPRRIVASPEPIALALGIVLAPLHLNAGIRRVVVTAFEAVSERGDAGIEELGRQAACLLNGQDVECDVFPARICFNVLPLSPAVGEGDEERDEPVPVAQLRKILDDPGLEVGLSRAWVPIFFGTGMSVGVELDSALDPGAARDLLRGSPGILLAGDAGPAGYSIADAISQDAALVSGVRSDPTAEHGLNFWIALDNVRKGRALNAVQIAEVLIRELL